MRRTEVLQGRRMMKFEELYSRRQARQLTQDQAAEIVVRDFRSFLIMQACV
jgi:hypothetical protein